MAETMFNKGQRVKLNDGEEGEIIAVPHDLRKPYVVKRQSGEEITARQRDLEKLGPNFPIVDPGKDFELTGNDVIIVASNPAEMEQGQKLLIVSVRAKEAQQLEEIKAAEETVAMAEAAGISAEPAKRLVTHAKSRALYLNKVAAALEAGYVMVPNFPGDTIAIRVNRQKPVYKPLERDSAAAAEAALPEQQPQRLPAGEGKYVDPTPFVKSMELAVPTGKPARFIGYATEFDEVIALPAEFLKPTVVKHLKAAMANKIFDEIIVSPPVKRRWSHRTPVGGKGDPLVLGRILSRGREYATATPRMLTFLIAWFQDTSVI